MTADSRASGHFCSGCTSESRPEKMAFVLMIDAENQATLEASISRKRVALLYMVGSKQTDGFGRMQTRPSDRLAQILLLVVEASTYKEIGRRLGISHYTVRNHVARLLRLYRARNLAQLLSRLDCRSKRA